VPVSVLIRRLSIAEVHGRQRARSDAEVARHNAHVCASPGWVSLRAQVLAEFDHETRRLCR
jgi:hypothetical protein